MTLSKTSSSSGSTFSISFHLFISAKRFPETGIKWSNGGQFRSPWHHRRPAVDQRKYRAVWRWPQFRNFVGFRHGRDLCKLPNDFAHSARIIPPSDFNVRLSFIGLGFELQSAADYDAGGEAAELPNRGLKAGRMFTAKNLSGDYERDRFGAWVSHNFRPHRRRSGGSKWPASGDGRQWILQSLWLAFRNDWNRVVQHSRIRCNSKRTAAGWEGPQHHEISRESIRQAAGSCISFNNQRIYKHVHETEASVTFRPSRHAARGAFRCQSYSAFKWVGTIKQSFWIFNLKL